MQRRRISADCFLKNSVNREVGESFIQIFAESGMNIRLRLNRKKFSTPQLTIIRMSGDLFNWFDWSNLFNWFGLSQPIKPMKQMKRI